MKHPLFCLFIVLLLSACSQSGNEIDYVPVRAGNQELQEIMIDEFERSGIDYRITEEGGLEADFARGQEISEIGSRLFDAQLPGDRSFNVNPDVLADFRAQLDGESISYRTLQIEGIDWTVVAEKDVNRTQEIKDLIFEAYLESQFPSNVSSLPDNNR